MKIILASVVSLILLLSITQAVPYDYYVQASFWAATCCKFNPCPNNQSSLMSPDFFNIHGMWPDYWNGYPSYCNNESSYIPNYQNQTFLLNLETYWSGMNGSTEAFHDHEWTKHGTCWNDPNGPNITDKQKQIDFFSTVYANAMRLNIYGTLAQAGVEPSLIPYDLSDLTVVLNETWGPTSYILQCEADSEGNQYLNSVYVCLNLIYEIIDCAPAQWGYYPDICPPGPVYYIPLDSVIDNSTKTSESMWKTLNSFVKPSFEFVWDFVRI